MRRLFWFFTWMILTSQTPLLLGQEEPPPPPPMEQEQPVPFQDPLYEELYRESEEVEATDFKSAFFRMLGILLLMVVALLVLSWLSRKYLQQRVSSQNRDSNIQILESRPISNKSTVHLVSIGGLTLAIGESPAGLVQLSRIPRLFEEEDNE